MSGDEGGGGKLFLTEEQWLKWAKYIFWLIKALHLTNGDESTT
jgi:hypothetical protein